MKANKDQPVLRIESERDFKDLVADLQAAARRSRRTGGEYPVYRAGAEGAILIRITIHFSIGGAAEKGK